MSMSTMTQQDMAIIAENARNKILERLVTKYDVQVACDGMRDRILAVMQGLHMENQALMRQSNANQDQIWRRTTSLEEQIESLRGEIESLNNALKQIAR